MNHPQLADKEHCTGCLVCADSCAQKAISCIIDDEGFYTYQVDGSKCVLCHRCEKVCPIINEMEYGSNDLRLSQPFAAWAQDGQARAKATSGGVFPVLAKTVIEQGGVVFGAEQEQYYVQHRCVEKFEDIERLQGSKYTQSKTVNVFSQVKEALSQGRKVLFSGVGCQVAALMSFLKGNKCVDALITIDLICGGVPSSLLIDKYVNNSGGKVSAIVSYRTKEKYQLKVKNESGNLMTIASEERPLPLFGFTSGDAKRYICYDCPFAKGHRASDITIGDYWGNNLYSEQKAKGVSVAIAHTEKGRRALEDAELETHEIQWRDFLLSNPRLVYGKARVSSHRKRMKIAFSSLNYEQILEQYANKGTWKKPWTILCKIYRILDGKITMKRRKHIVEDLLKGNNL